MQMIRAIPIQMVSQKATVFPFEYSLRILFAITSALKLPEQAQLNTFVKIRFSRAIVKL